MRILIASESFPPKAGGSGWSAYALARGLRARGHYVEIAQPRAGLNGQAVREYDELKVTEYGYHAYNVPGVRALGRRTALSHQFTPALALLACEFDVLHAQHLLTIPPAVEAARDSTVPSEAEWGAVVSTVRDYWPVCLYGTLWREEGVCPVCAPHDLLRCLRQRYGPLVELARPFLPFVQNELSLRQRSLSRSDAVIAVSRFVANTLHGVVPEDKLAVVPNLVDLPAETNDPAPEDDGIPEPFLLFAGKLNAFKGADLLPQIMERAGVSLPLIVAGDGALSKKLTGSAQLRLIGWVPNEKLLRLMRRATALVFPSRWAEPLARTLIEAQALGTPTVALNTGGTPDVIQHEWNGLLADDVESLAAQVRRVVDDAALRAQLSKNARWTAQTKFSAAVVLPQVEAVYARALGAHAGGLS